jgi:hypothetical protein
MIPTLADRTFLRISLLQEYFDQSTAALLDFSRARPRKCSLYFVHCITGIYDKQAQ